LKKSSIILIGGGGHCRSCIDVIEQTERFQIVGIVDVLEKIGQEVLGYPVIGTDDDLPDLVHKGHEFLIALGQLKSPESRMRLFGLLEDVGAEMATVVSPYAYLSRHASIGKGTIVMHHAVVNAGARVGENCIVNTRAVVEHDADISDHCHISTGALINGGVCIGSGVFFGSCAVAREYITIGDGSFVGANHVVAENLPLNSVVK
jgi:sugar O-acyltransferase (sialic acid O-acetyltransferase NeuD family)